MRQLWMRDKSSYRGLEMFCAPGTHEATMSLLLRHNPPRSSVLDLGAGTGAMLARLQDAGFADLAAVELAAERFQLRNLTSLVVDLNTAFAGQFDRRFALILAIEVIEHLNCPRDFLRQVRSLLIDGGYLLLTTPNVANWVGRLKFLLTGELRWFDQALYRRMRHVSPLTDTQMRLMLDELGFRLLESVTAGNFYGPLRRLVTAPISLAFGAIFGRRVWGDCSIYLATPSAA